MKLRLMFLLIASLGRLQAGNLLMVLSSSSQTGTPGTILPYFGTMTNVSATDTVFLNSISSTSVSGFIGIDTGPFFVNAPLSLGPGEVSSLFDIFDVTIDPATPDGLYSGSTVSIQGGADSGTFDDLADVSFDVVSATPSAATPEPGTGWLLLAGMVAFAYMCRKTRRSILPPLRGCS
jgi:hypothetical protein